MMLPRRRWLLTAALALAASARAEISGVERARIDRLIAWVATQKDLQFIRNGTAYSCSDAAEFLRSKFDKMGQGVNNAQQFIEQIATKSSMSGEPYLMRFTDGHSLPAAHVLHGELKRMER